MQKKNWVIPGFLVFAMLLLFSFPGLALADDNAQPIVTGGEISATQPAPQEQAIGGDTAAKQELEPIPAEDDVNNDPAAVNTTPAAEGKTVEDTDKPVADDSTSTDQGNAGEEAAPAPENPAPADQGNAGGDAAPVPGNPIFEDGDEVVENPQPDSRQPIPPYQSGVVVIPVLSPVLPLPAQGQGSETGVTPLGESAPVMQPVSSGVDVEPVVIPVTPSTPVYVVRPGDTIEKISQKTGVSENRIEEANGLKVDSKTVALPLEQASSTAITGSDAGRVQGEESDDDMPHVTYEVRKGESLWLIGRTLGVLYEAIMKANNLTDHLIYPDQKLIIPGLQANKGLLAYRIKAGDSLYFIGRALGISYENLMSLNGIKDIWIFPEQELRIPDRNNSSLYKVQEGDTLDEVAQKFAVSTNDITGYRISTDQLIVGQVLVIPVQPGVSRSNLLSRAIVPMGSDLEILARAIYGEARGEAYEGQVAVGAVIMNRLKTVGFPKTIRDIVFQPGAFTAVDDGQINLVPDETAYRAAQDAMEGADPSIGAIYYWNPDIATSDWIWSRPIVKQIGNHVFAR